MKKTAALLLTLCMIFAVLVLPSCTGSDKPTSTVAPKPSETAAQTASGASEAQPTEKSETPTGTEQPTTETPAETAIEKANRLIGEALALTSYAATIKIEQSVQLSADQTVESTTEYVNIVNGSAASSTRTVNVGGRTGTESVYTDGTDLYVKGAPEGAKASDYDIAGQVPTFVKPLENGEPVGDGSEAKAVERKMTDEEFAAAFGNILTKFTTEAAASSASAVVSDAIAAAHFGERLENYKLAFTLKIVNGEKEIVSSVTVTVTFDEAGTAKEVTAPADLDSYTKL